MLRASARRNIYVDAWSMFDRARRCSTTAPELSPGNLGRGDGEAKMNAVRKPHYEVDVSDPKELAAWAKYFNASGPAVVQAVGVVGKDPDAVAAQLGV